MTPVRQMKKLEVGKMYSRSVVLKICCVQELLKICCVQELLKIWSSCAQYLFKAIEVAAKTTETAAKAIEAAAKAIEAAAKAIEAAAKDRGCRTSW